MDPDPSSQSLIVTLVFIFFAIVLVFLNAFFVAAEFAIVKVRKTRLEELANNGNSTASLALSIVNKLDEYLSVCQLGITLVSLGLGWIGEQSFYALLKIMFPNPPFRVELFHIVATGISFFIISMLHVVLGELVPKSMAIQRAEKVTLVLAKPLKFFYLISKPLIDVFTALANLILKAIGFRQNKEDLMSEDELRMVISHSTTGGVISDSEAQIIQQAFSFSDKLAKDILIPADKVQYISLSRSFEENKEVILSRNHTRFPVCRTDMNDVIGILNMKDIRFYDVQDNTTFEEKMRPPFFIPAHMPEDKLMKQFKERRFHLAIVRNPEDHSTVGIVTLEDILEELVGDIVDEHGN